MTCFPIDSNGFEIIEFEGPVVDRSHLIIPHRLITFFMCTFGLFANLLLIAIVTFERHLLSNLRGIVLFAAVLETLYCLAAFVSMPLAYITHGRLLSFSNNGFHFSNQLVNWVILSVTSLTVLSCWSYVTFEFVYRLHLVKHRTAPKPFRLFLYVLIPVCSSFLYSYCSLNGFKLFETLDPCVYENRELILKHFGFSVSKSEILEVTSERPVEIDVIFGPIMLTNYTIIVSCVFQIRRHLRSGPIMSTTTKRMNREMDRVLIFNAFFPLLTFILPSAFVAYAISTCKDYPWFGFVNSFVMNLSFIFWPTSCLYFIRPYRKTAYRWLKIVRQKPNAVETIIVEFLATMLADDMKLLLSILEHNDREFIADYNDSNHGT
ncbi:hypothetical protein M3Y95_00839900 [Aphelenchoides besseyi]|nr:hypothetical protein M3Y95_00839900 [Aphelenchoides besseyi]